MHVTGIKIKKKLEERCAQVGLEFKFPPRDRTFCDFCLHLLSFSPQAMAVVILKFKPRPHPFTFFQLDCILCIVSIKSVFEKKL